MLTFFITILLRTFCCASVLFSSLEAAACGAKGPRILMRTFFPNRATGITTDVVEQMEKNLKRDVQREAISGEGRILLHDEVEDSPGQFTITPQWETVSVHEVMTPRVSTVFEWCACINFAQDVFELVAKEGYKVSLKLLSLARSNLGTGRLCSCCYCE